MAAKMAAHVALETYLVIYQPISSKLHVWITFITLSQDWLWMITKIAAQMAIACQFACVATLTWSFMIKFLPNLVN